MALSSSVYLTYIFVGGWIRGGLFLPERPNRSDHRLAANLSIESIWKWNILSTEYMTISGFWEKCAKFGGICTRMYLVWQRKMDEPKCLPGSKFNFHNWNRMLKLWKCIILSGVSKEGRIHCKGEKLAGHHNIVVGSSLFVFFHWFVCSSFLS